MLAPFLASGDTARGNKAKPLPPNIYILVVMTIRKEISKCQKLINAVEKNSELRSNGCWGTANLKKMPWEVVSEKVTFEQDVKDMRAHSGGSQEEECPRQKAQRVPGILEDLETEEDQG